MRFDARWTRAMMIVLLSATTVAGAVSPAAANHGRRYKDVYWGPRVVRQVVYYPAPRPVYVSHVSYGAPVLAGFVGGLIMGNAIAHAAPPVYCAAPVFYEDPYCHERFQSLDACTAHFEYVGHPGWVRVVDVRTGRCVGERYWQDGRWYDDDRYDDRGDGDGDN